MLISPSEEGVLCITKLNYVNPDFEIERDCQTSERVLRLDK